MLALLSQKDILDKRLLEGRHCSFYYHHREVNRIQKIGRIVDQRDTVFVPVSFGNAEVHKGWRRFAVVRRLGRRVHIWIN